MNIYLLENVIQSLLPSETAMPGDKIGLQIISGNQEVQRILITLEITENVIREAIQTKTDTIITFHPFIYYPLEKIIETDRIGNLTTKLIKNDINVIAIHTNYDSYINGTSKILADKLGLAWKKFLVPDSNVDGYGMGMIGEFGYSITEDEILEKVIDVCNSPIRYCSGDGKKIQSVAVLCGSGSSFISETLNQKVDCFITSDISYHQFHKVNGIMMMIDPGHYEMEQFVSKGLESLLKNETKHTNLEIICTKILTNPVRYYPDNDYTNKQINYLKHI